MKPKKQVTMLVALFVLTGLLTTLSLTNASTDRGMAVPPQELPDDLQTFDVEDRFIPAQGAAVGYIKTIQGHVVVVREDAGQAYFAAKGDAIFQQDSFVTLKKSRCRVKFTTQDVVTMGANTRITVEELVDDRKSKKKKSLLSMLRGKAMFYVVRLFKYKRTEASVTTPTAVCGVRGTQFGIEIVAADSQSAQAKPIYLADASGSAWPLLARAPNGIKTMVYFYDGRGELCNLDGSACMPIQKDQSGSVDETGKVSVGPADPESLKLLEQDTTGSEGETGGLMDMDDEQLRNRAGTRATQPSKDTAEEHTKDLMNEAIRHGDGFDRKHDTTPTGNDLIDVID